MNNPAQQPTVPERPQIPPTQAVPAPNQAVKPKSQFSDGDAQALLTMSDLQPKQHPKAKLPIGLLVTILAVVVLAVAAYYVIGSLKHNPNSSSTNATTNLGSPNQSNSTTQSVTNQVNQDVETCSNPVNATVSC